MSDYPPEKPLNKNKYPPIIKNYIFPKLILPKYQEKNPIRSCDNTLMDKK